MWFTFDRGLHADLPNGAVDHPCAYCRPFVCNVVAGCSCCWSSCSTLWKSVEFIGFSTNWDLGATLLTTKTCTYSNVSVYNNKLKENKTKTNNESKYSMFCYTERLMKAKNGCTKTVQYVMYSNEAPSWRTVVMHGSHTEVSCLLCIHVNINSTHNGMQFTWPWK